MVHGHSRVPWQLVLIAGPIAANGGSATVNISFEIDANFQGFSIVNYAEISDAENAFNEPDGDSTPDQDNTNDAGGQPESPADDAVNGDGSGTPGDGVAGTDEDDHDPALVEVDQTADIDIEKSTNGQDADLPPGVIVLVPDMDVPIEWEYVVTNTGTLDLIDVVVTDDQEGIVCTIPFLAAGATTSCNLSSTAIRGMYSNMATVEGQPVDDDGDPTGDPVDDEDPSNYTGVYINVEKTADKMEVCEGEEVTYTLTVRMLGGAPGIQIRDIMVDDDNLPQTLNVNSPEFVGGDLNNNGYIDFIDNDNDGISDEEFVFEYTLTLTQTTVNTAVDMGDVYFVDQNGNEIFVGSVTNTDQVTVVVNDNPEVTVTVDDQESCEENDGMLTANPTGGTPPYSYEWSNGEMTQSISGLADGDYTVTITDSKGCQVVETATIEEYCFDLALRKTVISSGPYSQGSTVTFQIEVINQGSVDATDVEVTDYIPSGLNLTDGAWAQAGNLATRTIAGPIAANGGSATVTISFQVDANFQGTTITNYAEISDAENALNLSDADSTPDQDNTNDAGGQPNSPADNAVNGDGSGTPGDGVAATDEDDHDPAQISIEQTFDLALRKTEVSSGPYVLGSTVTFEIEVFNQGDLDATNVEITDYIPTALTLADGAWAQAGALATRTIAGPIAANGGSASVTISFTVNSIPSAPVVNYAEISDADNALNEPDADSTPDQDNTNDAGGQPGSPADDFVDGNGSGTPGDGIAATDEDDHDPALISILTHEKEFVSATGTGFNTYDAVYTITVTNTGAATEYDLSDMPGFDGDIAINGASYSSTAPGNAGGPLAGTGPWTLADDQAIAANTSHTYTLTVSVTLNLTDGQSDDTYTSCGSSSNTPQSGEGLFNESRLDVNDDGTPDEIDEDCGDLPAYELDKELTDITPTGYNTYTVTYVVKVRNVGGTAGSYDLDDEPGFDDDIAITGASYASDAPGNAGGALAGSGPWNLANDQAIAIGAEHTYTLTVDVVLNLTDGQGSDSYTECGENGGPPTDGEGLYNEALLDVTEDGVADLTDDDCGDIPAYELDKTFDSADLQADGSYDVTYTVTVSNVGGAVGAYDLDDEPGFDDDISINSASYTSNAPGNAGGALAGSGPWELADDQSIAAGSTHTYTLVVNVTLNLTDGQGNDVYTECGENGGPPTEGEGLYNEALLDVTEDGVADLTADDCGDLPAYDLTKTFDSAVLQADGSYDVTYTITVSNDGGAAGAYDLDDEPGFDDDISINSASYTSNAPGNAGGALAGSGPWELADDQAIAAGLTHTYTLVVNVTLDLTDGQGNDVYAECGENGGPPTEGEGLYNEALLDVTEDGVADLTADDCGDLPAYELDKELTDITPTGFNTYAVTYEVKVRNVGGADGAYDLDDEPNFDDDISITGASYTSDAPGNAGGALAGSGPWELADDQSIAVGAEHTYTLTVDVVLDLTDGQGNDVYTECGENGGPPTESEGLYNEALLDVTEDGVADLTADDCGDLPAYELDKTFDSAVLQADGSYDVTYTITVSNVGGAEGAYDLDDEPGFDDDISINNASYTSTAPGNAGGALAGSGPWELADDQTIAAGSTHTYTLVVNVTLDLTDGQGNDVYAECGENGGPPTEGEGLYNEALLDVTEDGVADLTADDCGDLPAYELDKELTDITPTGFNTYAVTYEVKVRNVGGADGAYDLDDEPDFDDDISITGAAYTSDAPGNAGGALAGSGPWELADDQSIAVGAEHTYTLTVDVVLDLTDGQGNDVYTECGENGGPPTEGEGLYNEALLDVTEDGVADLTADDCGDLPAYELSKTFDSADLQANGTYDVTYTMTVSNVGGAEGAYDLEDEPGFDDDISINSASYSSDAPGNAGGALAGSGPWTLANDQSIAAGSTHTYTLVVNVTLDLTDGQGDDTYTACGENGGPPTEGEGLYNEALLDVTEDGVADLTADDCGDIEVFDLALAKVLDASTPGPFSQGSTVTFKVTVTNQGTVAATDIEVTDYIPTGLNLSDGNWSQSGKPGH